MIEGVTPSSVLLLGSNDPRTRAFMEKIKESIARGFPEHIYVVLLDDVETMELEDHMFPSKRSLRPPTCFLD